jgi:hypothetical protein
MVNFTIFTAENFIYVLKKKYLPINNTDRLTVMKRTMNLTKKGRSNPLQVNLNN